MKALIVEDDTKLATFLSRVLGEEGYIVDRCSKGGEAIAQIRGGSYDFVILDWMLPDIDGLTVCRDVRSGGTTTPIIMLTARGDVAERVLGLRAGADDYLGKPFEIEELLARIHALLRRSTNLGRLAFGDLEINRLGHRVLLAGRRLDLTSREYALLLHLAFNADRVVPRTALLSKVWGTNFDPGSNLIEVHVSRLRDKLGEHAWMIDTVRGTGYRLRTSREP
ncbi:MAG TPA: response regulator transcription factor [Polyangiaceae bacterium]|nr:response regulator transcription factor [Polyangiaceae bacterium]